MPSHEPHRLRRSTHDRMWAGIAGGMAEYFDIDPTLMRLIWVVATVVTAGLFVAVYLVMWVIMPQDTEARGGWRTTGADGAGTTAEEAAGPIPPPDYRSRRRDYGYGYGDYPGRRRRSTGIVLIVLGIIFLCSQAGLFRYINWSVAWAVVLIVIGGALLMRNSDRWRL